MRVLNAIHYPVFGGPHNQALRLAGPLHALGWETLVLIPAGPGNAASRLEAGGVDVVRMKLHRLRATIDPRPHLGLAAGFGREVAAISRLIRDRSIDVVQVSGLVNPHAALAARRERIPVVWQLLDTRTPNALALFSMMFVQRLADVVMSTGLAVADAHPGGMRLRPRLIAYFPPVDVDLFRPRPEDRASVRSEWGVPADAPVVGSVSNLNPQKGIIDLIRAFALVRMRHPEARLVLVGAEHPTHARYAAEVRRAVAASGLAQGRDITFVGERMDVERQLAGFDVFAFAPVPRSEGISTVVLEAMAAGLPVVSTAVAGLPEAIQDQITGRLVPPLDHSSMASAISDLLSDSRAAQRLGGAARRHAVREFAVGVCAETHRRAYELALTRRGRRTA